ncbi:MAG: Serine/threonine-protein phosphatase 1 [Pseudomonadota bacterium]|jgi:serine/threonine protein phosphatase 1
MLKSIRKIFRAADAPVKPAVPAGQRVYAMGDIHGRLDLFNALVDAIEADDRRRNRLNGSVQTTVILLGDLVDRGPDSAGVLALAREWQRMRRVRILIGNHEEMMLASLKNTEKMRHFLRYGGRETVLSFGIDPDLYTEATFDEIMPIIQQHVPLAALDFIRSFEDQIRIGDYLFVHAGIRPEVAAEAQRRSDMRWIREPFLSYNGDHGFVVVHGHTITDDVEVKPNRIGIDTGAYLSGKLTALCLEGQTRCLIEALDVHGQISTTISAMD